jgi:DNA-binding NtrC family response regulator
MPQQQSSATPVVLIVENDVLLRLVTASNLRDAGFEPRAANSAEAIHILDCIPVDALFSDIDMPGTMDDLALAQWVHQRRVDTRIILTSGAARALGGAREYASFLPKPYANKDVEHLVEAFFLHPGESNRQRRI